MGFSIGYDIIAELALWHHRHLDGPPGGLFTLPPFPPAPFPAPPPALFGRLREYDVRRWMEVRPTPDSEKLLAQKNLQFRPSSKGGIVVAKQGFSNGPGEDRITLVLKLIEPAFLTYTDFDLTIADNPATTTINEDSLPSMQGQVFFLSNFSLPAGSGLLGSAPGLPHLRTAQLVPLRTRVVRLQQTVPGTASQVRVFAQNSAVVTPVKTFDMPAVTDQTQYELDCRSLPEGYYRFEGANVATTRYYLGLENMASPFAIVELLLNKITNPTRYDIRLAKLPN